MAFIDRIVEHPGRVQLTNVSGDIYDLERAEGEVYSDGTLLNANNLISRHISTGTSKHYIRRRASPPGHIKMK